MSEIIKTVAFDLGGVLASQDYSLLQTEELALVKAYLNRANPDRVALEAQKAGVKDSSEFLREAEARIGELYPKFHVMSDEGMQAILTIKEMGLSPSIWTNNIWAINNWFEKIGLYDHINPDYICNSIAMGEGNADKPNIAFYRSALGQLKNDAKQVLFIDDDLVNVAAGLGYGIPSIQYNMFDQRADGKALSKVASDTVTMIQRSR